MLKLDEVRVALDAEQGWVKALDGVSLALQRGQTFALVGESGCGKSMTALAIMRLLPDSGLVTGGDIALTTAGLPGQTDVTMPMQTPMQHLLALPESSMRRVRGGKIGIIFQEPSTCLNPVMRVGEQMREAIETHTALRGEQARRKALDWLRRVGIPEPERRIDSYPFELSGGQKQRVMIAMTLAAEPDYLIADEPTTALDVTIQKQVLDLLKDLQQERQLGVLLITHDLAVVAQMAHHVALMYAGQIVEQAPAAEFFAHPSHPYAHLLLQALPDVERRGHALTSIAGTVPPLWQSFSGCRFAPRCQKANSHCHTQAPMLAPWPDASVADGQRLVRCWLPHVAGATGGQAEVQKAGLPTAVPPTHQSAPVVLSVKHLSVAFKSKGAFWQAAHVHRAVAAVSFDIRAGQTLALVGESGCGKTTTGRAILQLLREQPHVDVTGQAWCQLQEGQAPEDLFALSGQTLRHARRAVQMVFQDPFASLNPRMRVQALLEEGMLSLRPEWDATHRQQRMRDLLDHVGLRADALTRFPHEFSGGQRQRLAIARALAVAPRVLVCDEPTSALDVSVQAQILNLLHDIQAQLGLALLFITHNMGVVAYMADEVAVMHQGRIVEQGAALQVLQQPQHAYTKTLLAAVPRPPVNVNATRLRGL